MEKRVTRRVEPDAASVPKRPAIASSCTAPPDGRTAVVIAGSPSRWRSLEQLQAQEQGLVFVWCPAAASEVLDYCRRLVPCVLIVDEPFLAEVDEVRFSELIQAGRTIKVLVQSSQEEPGAIARLLRLGCVGVFRPDSRLAVLRRAVRAVVEGELWVSRKALSRLVQELLRKESCRLTDREDEILRLVGKGYRNQEIAEHLFLSPQTVRWHLRSLYAKLGLHNRRRGELHALGGGECAPPAEESTERAKPPKRVGAAEGTGVRAGAAGIRVYRPSR